MTLYPPCGVFIRDADTATEPSGLISNNSSLDLNKNLENAFKTYADRPFLCTFDPNAKQSARCDFHFVTYQWFERAYQRLARNIMANVKRFSTSRPIGIYGTSKVEWFLVEHANRMLGAATVAFHDNWGDDTLLQAIQTTLPQFVFCDVALMAKLRRVFPSIPAIALPDYVRLPETVKRSSLFCGLVNGEEEGDQQIIHTYEAPDAVPPVPEGTLALVFTSGSSGPPKAVVKSHNEMNHDLVAYPCAEGSVTLQYMPIYHFTERHRLMVQIFNGGRVAIISDGVESLIKGLACFRPTLFFGVPATFRMLGQKLRMDPSFGNIGFGRIRTCVCGSGTLDDAGRDLFLK
eukprot:PhF_6_TR35410/c0_g2_i2/m.51537/K01897/ACSL, fadD; long-chain acyl-CoA synthetase